MKPKKKGENSMNRLVFFLLSLFALVNNTTYPIIWARKLWVHAKTSQVVEVWYDTHAEYYSEKLCTALGCPENEQEELLKSNQIEQIATQQQHDIIAYAQYYKENLYLYMEDKDTFVKPMGYAGIEPKYSVLAGLEPLVKAAHIPYINLEFRYPEADYDAITEKIDSYRDTPQLNNYYLRLKELVKRDFIFLDMPTYYLFNVSLVHTVYIGTSKAIPRQIFIGGSLHGLALSIALPLMGYTCSEDKTIIHSELQKILRSPENKSERIIKKYTQEILGYQFKDYKARITTPSDNALWSAAFNATHPININKFLEYDQFIDKQRAKKKKASGIIPAILRRSRL